MTTGRGARPQGGARGIRLETTQFEAEAEADELKGRWWLRCVPPSDVQRIMDGLQSHAIKRLE